MNGYLRMKPPLMAICSRSSTTRAPGWLFTTPSWFPPQAWPPPLILPHIQFSQSQCSFLFCMFMCVHVYTCLLMTEWLCICVFVGWFVYLSKHVRQPVSVNVSKHLYPCGFISCYLLSKHIYMNICLEDTADGFKPISHLKATCQPRMIRLHTCICSLLANNWSNMQINWIQHSKLQCGLCKKGIKSLKTSPTSTYRKAQTLKTTSSLQTEDTQTHRCKHAVRRHARQKHDIWHEEGKM